MADRELRLRLQVRRHGLPDVNLLWNAPTGPESTVSKLVEKVNEIVPLESADWGLEDYVLELKSADGTSFECLHFQQVDKVLKDEDQVIIRSLLTDDIRIRRASGRHQITTDGRHLVDGVAYGRRWLNAPRNRPPVDLPPRKRTRIEPTDDYYDDDEEDEGQLLLDYPRRDGSRRTSSVRFAARHEDEELDEDEEDDEDYDEDYEPDPQPVRNVRTSNTGQYNGGPQLASATISFHPGGFPQNNVPAYSPYNGQPPRPNAPTPSTAARGPPLTRKRKAYDASSYTEESLSEFTDDTSIGHSEMYMNMADYGVDELDESLSESDDDTVIRHPQVYDAATLGSERSSTIPSIVQEFADSEMSAGGYDTVVRHGGFDRAPGDDISNVNVSGASEFESESESSSEYESDSLSEYETRPKSAAPVEVAAVVQPVGSSNLPQDTVNEGGTSEEEESKSESGLESETDESSSDSDGSEESDTPLPAIKPAKGTKAEKAAPTAAVKAAKPVPKAAAKAVEPESESESDSDDSSSESDSDGSSIMSPQQSNPPKLTKAALKAAVKAANSEFKPVVKAANPESDASSSSSEDSSDSDSDSSSSSSDDDSDESSESDSEPDEVSSKPAVAHITNLDKASTDKPAESGTTDTVAPGHGLSKTQRRNLRRRLAKAGGRSDQTGKSDAANLEATAATEMSELQLRKQALLDLMHADTLGKSQAKKKANGAEAAGAPTPYAPGNFPESLYKTTHDTAAEVSAEPAAEAEKPVTDDASTSPTVQRRLKLNVDAGRRILFGALGFANPKTKAAEEKVRDKLMKDVRPVKNHRAEEEAKAAAEQAMEVDAPMEEEDPDAWRKSINYRAVECCQEDIELSEPPFPFVQRWDPQQQGNFGKKKNKRKHAQEANAQHEEETAITNHKKSKTGDEAETPDVSWAAFEDSAVDDIVLNYDDPPSVVAANDSQFSDLDDLPSLPADVTTLPMLISGAARPGMVITYKHWRLGGAASWGPELVDQTAVVVKTEGDDGSQIRLLLAKRDRESETAEKVYDEVTGQRIYGRFEVPDFDEDEEDDGIPKAPDDWYRDISFSELIEPRIVQQPPKAYGGENDASLPEIFAQETQFEEMDVEAPTSAQPQAVEQQSSSTETLKEGEKEHVAVQQEAGTSRSESLEKRSDGASERLQTNSPSRQLREMAADQPPQSPKPDAASDASQDVVPDSVPEASTDGGIHSGRQPDPDFLGDDAGNSPERLVNVAEDTSQELTPKAPVKDAKPKAEPAVSTPKRGIASSTPSSVVSLPTLDEVWNTATTSRQLRSASKSGPESSLPKLKSEFAGAGLSTPKKNLFPNSTQPVNGSVFSPVDEKPRLSNMKTRRTATFTIPEGSQIVSLSSDDDEAPLPEENYAEDEIDADYGVGKRTSPRGKTRAQKNPRRGAAKGKGKAKDLSSRAVSMPASARGVLRRGAASASAVYSRKGRRAASTTAWDGEI